VADLHETWMRQADRALDDRQIVAVVHEALAQRHPQSRKRGRRGVPAEVVLRLLVLKHIRNWSYQVLNAVRANLVYRDFTRVGGAKTPDAKTMGRHGPLGRGVGAGSNRTGPCEDRADRASERGDARPAAAHRHDSGRNQLPLSDRQQPASPKQPGPNCATGRAACGTHLLNIARAARSKSPPNQEKPTEIYGELLAATGRVVGQAKRFSREIAGGAKRAADPRRQLRLVALRQHLEQMLPRLGQVMRQTHARIFAGDTRAEGKIVSIFDPSTEVIRKGKAGKPTEFGKMVKLQEAENQIIIADEVYDGRPSDGDLLIPAIEIHEAKPGADTAPGRR
jgi:IS5 family transposase